MSFVVVGESLIDQTSYPDGEHQNAPGGSPLNVAVGLGRLHDNVTLVTEIGDDAFGQAIREYVEANNVDLIADVAGRTSTAHAIIQPDGSANYDFAINWNGAAGLTAAQNALETATAIHTGSIAAHLAPGADAALHALKAHRSHALTSYDPNCRASIVGPAPRVRSQAEQFIALSDVVKASDEDIAWMYPHDRYQDVAQRWLDIGAGLVVITRGRRSVWCATQTGIAFDAPAVPINVVDTIGAGDSFMATLLHGLVENNVAGSAGTQSLTDLSPAELRTIIQQATRAAAITCTRTGADPPTLDELRRVEPRAPATGLPLTTSR